MPSTIDLSPGVKTLHSFVTMLPAFFWLNCLAIARGSKQNNSGITATSLAQYAEQETSVHLSPLVEALMEHQTVPYLDAYIQEHPVIDVLDAMFCKYETIRLEVALWAAMRIEDHPSLGAILEHAANTSVFPAYPFIRDGKTIPEHLVLPTINSLCFVKQHNNNEICNFLITCFNVESQVAMFRAIINRNHSEAMAKMPFVPGTAPVFGAVLKAVNCRRNDATSIFLHRCLRGGIFPEFSHAARAAGCSEIADFLDGERQKMADDYVKYSDEVQSVERYIFNLKNNIYDAKTKVQSIPSSFVSTKTTRVGGDYSISAPTPPILPSIGTVLGEKRPLTKISGTSSHAQQPQQSTKRRLIAQPVHVPECFKSIFEKVKGNELLTKTDKLLLYKRDSPVRIVGNMALLVEKELFEYVLILALVYDRLDEIQTDNHMRYYGADWMIAVMYFFSTLNIPSEMKLSLEEAIKNIEDNGWGSLEHAYYAAVGMNRADIAAALNHFMEGELNDEPCLDDSDDSDGAAEALSTILNTGSVKEIELTIRQPVELSPKQELQFVDNLIEECLAMPSKTTSSINVEKTTTDNNSLLQPNDSKCTADNLIIDLS